MKIQKHQNQHYTIPQDGIAPGGRLYHFLDNWKQQTTHQWPLSVIGQGYKLQFQSNLVPWKLKPIQLSPIDQKAVDNALEKFKIAQVIKRSPSQDQSFLSQFFTIKEPNKLRPILDCRIINQYLQCQHFKMEGVPALREILEDGDYMVKIDLKDAYVVVPINQEYQKYLTFLHQVCSRTIEKKGNSLSILPRRYLFDFKDETRIEGSNSNGIITLNTIRFSDRLGEERFRIKTNTRFSRIHIQHEEHADHSPSGEDEQINVKNQTIGEDYGESEDYTCRWIAGLLRKMTSLIPAIGETLLHLRYLQRDLAVNLKQQQYQWDKPCILSAKVMEELTWWKTQATAKNGLPLQKQIDKSIQPAITIHVDASDSGWGVASSIMETSGTGPWKKEQSINVRELKTILFALQLHKEKFKNCTIQIFSDNTTAIKYVAKNSGTASAILHELALEIQEIRVEYNIQIKIQHIPGLKNITADRLSRITKPVYEWTLPRRWFNKIQQTWGRRKIDAFASRINTRLPTFWSFQADPQAAGVDAFKQTCCVLRSFAVCNANASCYRYDPRSEKVVADMYARYLASGGDKTLLVNVDTGYKLVGGQALVDLQSFNTVVSQMY
ncbi:hypothetical protein INT47_005821 [Mucor saturninus]|uniref:RNase H type-1 domain-containing protein n=1 Tax=Mucor saturninus TaxID=64648 RepID=A0A8H7QYN5_9FUNG|nr:hypothetical protein INT47_005821 [Mucor saturninus]